MRFFVKQNIPHLYDSSKSAGSVAIKESVKISFYFFLNPHFRALYFHSRLQLRCTIVFVV